jgi:hypothetical protein
MTVATPAASMWFQDVALAIDASAQTNLENGGSLFTYPGFPSVSAKAASCEASDLGGVSETVVS